MSQLLNLNMRFKKKTKLLFQYKSFIIKINAFKEDAIHTNIFSSFYIIPRLMLSRWIVSTSPISLIFFGYMRRLYSLILLSIA